ncbi:MAG: hypothetical protein AAF542_21015 [Pseudomonadota bacterium]
MNSDNVNLSTGLKIAIFITAFQAWRISALAFLTQVGDTLPEFWGMAFRGDSFIAITALPVAYLLWKHRNLQVWTVGIIWQSLGFADLYFALESQFIHPVADISYFVIPAGMIMHSLALYLIFRNHDHYFELQRH